MSSGEDPSRWVWLVTAADQSRGATWTLAPLTNPFRSGRARSRVVYAKWSLWGRSYYGLFAISGAEWVTLCIFFIFIMFVIMLCSTVYEYTILNDFSKHIFVFSVFQVDSKRFLFFFLFMKQYVEIWYRSSIDKIGHPYLTFQNTREIRVYM